MLRRKYLRLLGFLALVAAMVALNSHKVFDPPQPLPSGHPVDFAHGPGEKDRRTR